MVTLSDAIFCYITNSTEFNAKNRIISKERFKYRFCGSQNTAHNLTAALRAVRPPRFQLTLVRHPIEKFLSGFVDKCIIEARQDLNLCFSCNGDMSCFVHQLTKHLRQLYEKNGGLTTMGVHFAPQSWFCRFDTCMDDFIIIKHRSGEEGAAFLAAQFNSIFRDAGVPENIRNEIHKEMLVGRTHHSTFGNEVRGELERTLMNNVTLLTEVVQLYYYDFVLFDYELPSVF
ncbi:hypothetical protein Q1695_007185 [Nippostrongylus brasiliensis]|nr:hypothetical protein Q1695_007185 [Nippostrongylus brasiliensis]